MKLPVLCLNPKDNVAVALKDLEPGTVISRAGTACAEPVPMGHKVAIAPIGQKEPVIKYGQVIGLALAPISPGRHVHTHNLSMENFSREGTGPLSFTSPDPVPEQEPAFFDGIVREDGRVATRNFIGVVGSVNCSASVCRLLADRFAQKALADFPNVDGVVPVIHGWGCGMAGKGEGYDHLAHTLAGYLSHPNFTGVILVGLGCEVMQPLDLVERWGLAQNRFFRVINIQEAGGTAAAVEKGAQYIQDMLPQANQVLRQPVPAGRMVLGLECGGSDAWSGITANPALGAAVDLLVGCGGTAILGETPEIYGAEHLLTRRAVSSRVAEKLLERIAWWETYTAKNNGEMDNNPSPGNKAGGLTTIAEKSLGAVAKGGSFPLADVVTYARPVRSKGLVFMDTPGYDPVSVTGMVAGGANMVCFTTGRGSVFGSRPVPCLKLTAGSAMYHRMKPDMDMNCGVMLDEGVTVEEMGRRIFEALLLAASGEKTKSEIAGVGNDEFVPWQTGAVM